MLGISSANCPRKMREEVWQKLASEYMPKNLETIRTHKIKLEDVFDFSEKLINRELHGRTIIKFDR